MARFIYKIMTHGEWADFRYSGTFRGTAADLRDGYIHFSDGSQLSGTVARHYATEEQVIVLEIEVDAVLADLRWERSRRGELYPHLYRALRLRDVGRVDVLSVEGPTPTSNTAAMGTIPQAWLPPAT